MAVKAGAAALCLKAGIPCIPMALVGATEAMPRGRSWPVPGRPPVYVAFGEPERVPIEAIRNGTEVQGLPVYQMLSTRGPAFARYAAARANRRDQFFIAPAGGVDACNVPVPIRRAP